MTTDSVCVYGPQRRLHPHSPYPRCCNSQPDSLSESAVKVHVFGSSHQGLWTTTVNTQLLQPHTAALHQLYLCAYVFAHAYLYVHARIFLLYMFSLLLSVIAHASLLTDLSTTLQTLLSTTDVNANTRTRTLHWLLVASLPNGLPGRGDLKTPRGAEIRIEGVKKKNSRMEEIKLSMQMGETNSLKCEQVIWLLCQDTCYSYISLHLVFFYLCT